MRPIFQAFAVVAVLASTGCSQPYGYSTAGYGVGPSYGYGYPGGYSYAGPGYAYAPPPYAYGGVIGVGGDSWRRDDWRRDDWRRYDVGNRGGDDQRWRGNQPGSDRARASQQRFQQQRQTQQLRQQPKQPLDSGWTPRSPR